jgi:hypothetical protein
VQWVFLFPPWIHPPPFSLLLLLCFFLSLEEFLKQLHCMLLMSSAIMQFWLLGFCCSSLLSEIHPSLDRTHPLIIWTVTQKNLKMGSDMQKKDLTSPNAAGLRSMMLVCWIVTDYWKLLR